MSLKYKLMILVAGILALTSSLLTALGMADLFQGLFVVFLVIDLGRFLVLNFIVDEWHNLKKIKWVLTSILAILFIYSAVGVYNKLNTMIPATVQTAMIEAASYNQAQDNAQVKQNRSEGLASVAQSEYEASIKWNIADHENCLKRANGDIEKENKCNNTKRRLDNSASSKLKQALKEADTNLDKVQVAVQENVKNQSEIAGILSTVCKLLPGTDCKTYDGLQVALTIIILLTICGLDYLQLGIVLAVNTRKNKEKEIKEEKTLINTKKIKFPKISFKKDTKIEQKQAPEQPKLKKVVKYQQEEKTIVEKPNIEQKTIEKVKDVPVITPPIPKKVNDWHKF